MQRWYPVYGMVRESAESGVWCSHTATRLRSYSATELERYTNIPIAIAIILTTTYSATELERYPYPHQVSDASSFQRQLDSGLLELHISMVHLEWTGTVASFRTVHGPRLKALPMEYPRFSRVVRNGL